MVAQFVNGLLGIGDEIEKNLGKLAGVAQNGGKAGLGDEIDGDAIGAQGMFVKLKAALNQVAQLHGGLARLGRAGKRKQALHDLSGAARLTMRKFKLAAHGGIDSGIAQEFGDPQDGGKGIVQFMGDAGDHLAHGREAFGLD